VPEVRCFNPGEASDDLRLVVRLLLEQAFAGDFSPADWEHALGGWHVVAAVDGVALAHAAVVPRVLEVGGDARHGYVESVVTAAERQREGLGSAVMTEVGKLLCREFEFGALATGRHW
jgi:aminoglycoside 2'-N-acetyltransferase I